MKETKNSFEELIRLMETLRSENGCAWDKEQDHYSLKQYMIEEVHEVIEAIDENNTDKFKEELGDLLFQVIFHAQIAAENGEFTMNDILRQLLAKMIHRHPHVFGDTQVGDSDAAIEQWNEIKRKEKAGQSVLNGVPSSLPALFWAYKIQQKAASIGFDWDDMHDVVAKMKEELTEFEEAVNRQSLEHIAHSEQTKDVEEELGDVLFSIVNIARHLDINAELALRKTVDKFRKRFVYLEQKITKAGKKLEDCTLKEMDVLWEESKKNVT